MSAVSVAPDIQSGLKVAGSLIRASLQEKLVYRFDLIIGLLRTFILILVFRYLWLALYGGRATFAGVSLEQTITYATVSMIIGPLYPNSLILDVGARLRTGNILFDITRPLYYGNLLLFQTCGQFLATLVTSALPMFVLALFFVDLNFPASPLIWLAFGVSLLLGFLIAFLVDYLTSLAGFWLTETWGIFFAKWSITDVLSGKYLPLWIFPPLLRQFALMLPFRGMSYSPLAIFIGQVPPGQIPLELGLQVFWIIVLALLGRWLYGAAVKKLAVQGG